MTILFRVLLLQIYLDLLLGTAGYFQRLGLLSKDIDATEKETDINILFNMALSRLVFMPFGYLVDKYRWDLYSGWADESNMNCHWVKLRMDIQGDSDTLCYSLQTVTNVFFQVWLRQTSEQRRTLMLGANTMLHPMWDT